MNMNALLLLNILVTFASCHTRDQKPAEHRSDQPIISIGDTVTGIGRNIRHIFQDNKDNFWFATDGEGVFRYDGKTILHLSAKNGLCGNNARLVQQDKDGNILIATGSGVCIFDGKGFRAVQPGESSIPAPGLADIVPLFGNYCHAGSIYPFNLPQTSTLKKSYSQTPYAVYCSFKDSKGNIWFGTESRGVCKYDGKTFTWLDNEELGLAVRSIFEDRNGNIWIGNNGNGLFRYDGTTLVNFTKEHKLGNPDFQVTLAGKEGTLARVWAITGDKEGNLWVGTIDAGLWKYDGKALTNYTIKNGLASNSIQALYCDRNGNIWIGADNGITEYNGKTFTSFASER